MLQGESGKSTQKLHANSASPLSTGPMCFLELAVETESQVARIFSFGTDQVKQSKRAYFMKSMGCQNAAYEATVCSHNLVRQVVTF